MVRQLTIIFIIDLLFQEKTVKTDLVPSSNGVNGVPTGIHAESKDTKDESVEFGNLDNSPGPDTQVTIFMCLKS